MRRGNTLSKPLAEWIFLAQNRPSLDSILQIASGNSSGQLPNANLSQYRYLNKILREEAQRQFKEFHRPLEQTIANAIDAKPQGMAGPYEVRVKIDWANNFVCEDRGESKSLEDLLLLLVMPFTTDKRIGEHIGRHGVGFLSTINYILRAPGRAEVSFSSYHPSGSYELKLWSPKPDRVSDAQSKREIDVSSVYMSITKLRNRRRRGSTVAISHSIDDAANVKSYLEQMFENFSRHRAIIRLNRKSLNREFVGDALYFPVEFGLNAGRSVQEVGIIISHPSDPASGHLFRTSQGIKIDEYSLHGANIKIDFPPAVALTEGRDEFVLDANYKSALQGVYSLLAEYVRLHPQRLATMQTVVASLSASLEINHPNEIPAFGNIRDALFGGNTYITTANKENMVKFYGNVAAEKIYEADEIGFGYWSKMFSSISKFHHRYSAPVITVDDLRQLVQYDKLGDSPNNPRNLPNFRFLISRLASNSKEISGTLPAIFVAAGEFGVSPFLFEDKVMRVNVAHPLMQEETTLNKYLFVKRFYEAVYPNPQTAEGALRGVISS